MILEKGEISIDKRQNPSNFNLPHYMAKYCEPTVHLFDFFVFLFLPPPVGGD